MKFLKFEQLDSTNNYAKTLIKEGKAKDRQLIYAVEQTTGRGQAAKIWESESGKNLTFSLIIEPTHIEPKEQFIISQAVSVGIVNYLKFHVNNERINIKFPNDIFVDMKKICGILIENTIQGDQFLFCVIGIGLNVNQTKFSENAGNPTSLNLLTNTHYDLEIELNELARSIINTLDSLRMDGGKDCKIRYSEYLLSIENNPNIADPLPLIEANSAPKS